MNKNLNELYEYANSKCFDAKSYSNLSDAFANEIKKELDKLVLQEKELELKLQGINLIFEQSPLIGSTAFGFILESYVRGKIESDSGTNIEKPESGVTNTSYDFTYKNPHMKVMINFKVQKNGIKNNAVSAINQFLNDYCFDSSPKIFFVYKINYEIDQANQKVKLIDSECYPIESYIEKDNKQDNRNWGSKYTSKINGRFSVDSKSDRKNRSWNDVQEILNDWIDNKGISIFEAQIGISGGDYDLEIKKKIEDLNEIKNKFNE